MSSFAILVQAVFPCKCFEVIEDLSAASVHGAPIPLGLKGPSVAVRWNVTSASRILVLPPSSGDFLVLLIKSRGRSCGSFVEAYTQTRDRMLPRRYRLCEDASPNELVHGVVALCRSCHRHVLYSLFSVGLSLP